MNCLLQVFWCEINYKRINEYELLLVVLRIFNEVLENILHGVTLTWATRETVVGAVNGIEEQSSNSARVIVFTFEYIIVSTFLQLWVKWQVRLGWLTFREQPIQKKNISEIKGNNLLIVKQQNPTL